MKNVLVIGGGAAGLAAGLELARRGIPSTLVERSSRLGGTANQLACKGSPQCMRCDACYPRDLLAEAARSPLVNILTGSEVVDVERRDQGFSVMIRTNTGLQRIAAGAVVLATGAQPYDADRDARLHHLDCPDVLSAMEVERVLTETGQLTVPSTGRTPQELAIVQCVGSRDVRRGMPYCSKACCKYAYRLGRHLRSLYPDLKVTFFFMDWRPLGDPNGALEAWAADDENVRIIRSRPAEILPGERPVVRYAPPGEFVAEESFDLVMLSVGMVPGLDNAQLASRWGLGTDEHGFLMNGEEKVFVAGTCTGPRDIRESVEQGLAAAGRAARALEGA